MYRLLGMIQQTTHCQITEGEHAAALFKGGSALQSTFAGELKSDLPVEFSNLIFVEA